MISIRYHLVDNITYQIICHRRTEYVHDLKWLMVFADHSWLTVCDSKYPSGVAIYYPILIYSTKWNLLCTRSLFVVVELEMVVFGGNWKFSISNNRLWNEICHYHYISINICSKKQLPEKSSATSINTFRTTWSTIRFSPCNIFLLRNQSQFEFFVFQTI